MEDLPDSSSVACYAQLCRFSLLLVWLFDRIVPLDTSFKPGRDCQLRNRLAEAVRKDSLQSELRRLNSEHPELQYLMPEIVL